MFTNSALQNRLQQAFVACQSNDTNTRKQGEQELQSLQQDTQYPLYLFNFIAQSEQNVEIHLRAAIEFKQWFGKYVQVDDYQAQCLSETVNTIKGQIFEAFIQISQKNKTVGLKVEEAIVYLAEREFSHNWGDLISKMNQQLTQTFNSQENIQISINVLKLLKKMTKKYEFNMRSDALYTEIIHVCDEAHDTLFALTQETINMLNQGQQQQDGNQQSMILLVKLLKNLMIIFYHLNFQDLHPKFEDNLTKWMQLIANVLRLNLSPQQLNNNDIVLFKCKGEALRGILLYATKYREDFMGLIKDFSSEIWNMCTITSTDPKFDKIVLNSLRYFKNLVLSSEFKDFFTQNMDTLLNSLIIPNLGVSKQDREMFEYEPESFIQSYFENSDVQSRRSTTVELLRNLCRHYQSSIQGFIQNVIPKYVEKLNQNQSPSYDEEIILINLVIDGSTIAYRPKDGVSEVSMGPELITYFYNNVIKYNLQQMVQHVQSGNKIEQKYDSVYVSFYLRFFFYFRHYIPKEEILEITKIVSSFTLSDCEALQDLAYFTVEMLLNLKEGDMKTYINLKPYFTKDNIEPQIQQILQNIYTAMKGKPLNQYALRAVVVIIQILKENNANYIDALADLFKGQLVTIKEGYDFQKACYIFDGIGILIYYTQKGNADKINNLENMISNELNYILQNQKKMSDLFAFVLQIYSLFVQNNFNKTQNSHNYKVYFTSLMETSNWVQDNQSLFQAYVTYIKAYVQASPQDLYDNINNLQNILQSVSNMRYDQIFFQLADSICEQLTLDQLRQSGILRFIIDNAFNFYQNVLGTSQTDGKSQKRINKPLFVKEFINYINKLIVKHTAQQILTDFNAKQNNILTDLLVNEIQLIKLISTRNERKLVFLALTDLLLQNVSALSQDAWGQLINAIIENCGHKQNSFRGQKTIQFVKEKTANASSDSGFQKLQAIKWADITELNKALNEINNEDLYFAQKFKDFYGNSQIQQAINFQQVLTQQNQQTLSGLMQNC